MDVCLGQDVGHCNDAHTGFLREILYVLFLYRLGVHADGHWHSEADLITQRRGGVGQSRFVKDRFEGLRLTLRSDRTPSSWIQIISQRVSIAKQSIKAGKA